MKLLGKITFFFLMYDYSYHQEKQYNYREPYQQYINWTKDIKLFIKFIFFDFYTFIT